MWKPAAFLILPVLCLTARAGDEEGAGSGARAAAISAGAAAVDAGKILSGKADYGRTVDDTRAIGAGAKVVIEHSMGSVEVLASDGADVRVQAWIEAKGDEAQEFGEQITIDIDDGDPFTVTTEYPSGQWDDLSYGVRLKITVPADHPVEVDCSFGDLTLSGIRGAVKADAANGDVTVDGAASGVTIASSFGKVAVSDCKGPIDVKNSCGGIAVADVDGETIVLRSSFGGIKLEDAAGQVEIASENGGIEAVDVRGPVKSHGTFDKQVFRDIAGTLEVSGANSTITAEDIGGEAEIETAFGNIELTDCTGGARIETKNGAVKCRDVGGDLAVANQFGGIDAGGIAGSCTVTCVNGAVKIEDVAADLTVENRFGPVEAAGVGGDVTIDCTNGRISLRGIAYAKAGGEAANRIELRNAFGGIELVLPDPPSATLEASTSFGRIESDFELPGLERGMTSEHCRTTLGDGKAAVVLKTANGSIRIKKESRKKM